MKSSRKKTKAEKKLRNAPTEATTRAITSSLASWLPPLLIFLLTVAAFLPALRNGFVDWDDKGNLLENPHYRGLSWGQLRWMFMTLHMGHYQPLSWVTLGLDYLLWGMNPFGYHLTSLLLHAVNSVLFYFVVVWLLTLAWPGTRVSRIGLRVGAGFAALLFALHPLRVESVAWATERRDVLSGLFFLWAILCYLRYAVESKPGRWGWMTLAVVIYGLSLLSKASGLTLPVVLWVLDVYPLKRLGAAGMGTWFGPGIRRVWWEKLPFLLLAIGAMPIALLAQYRAGEMRSFYDHPVVSRVAQALYGLAFYLWKTIWPVRLSPLYELPAHLSPGEWPFVLSGTVVLGLSVGLFLLRRRFPAGLAIWASYGVIVAPVLGLTQAGPQLVADRYSYLSCLGWAVLAGAGVLYSWRLWEHGRMRWMSFGVVQGLVVVVVAGLGVLTWRQVEVWRDSETLWEYVLSTGQESSIAHNNLGIILAARGQSDKAMEHYRAALRINPGYADAHNNVGTILAARGGLDEAIEQYREALKIDPAHARAHYNLGNVLALRGELDEAIEQYREALRLNPGHAEAYNNLGNVLASRGGLDEAIEQYREALKIDPAHARAHYNLGNALASRGELDGAIEQYREALQLNPAYIKAHYSLGVVLARRDSLDQAITHFRQALKLQPGFAAAHESLGRTLALQGKREEAIRHYEEALRILKSQPEAKPSS